MQILSEICTSDNEHVQKEVTRAFALLLRKFPQKNIIIFGAEHILQLFTSTKYADVAIACIETFHDISPLQFKVFDGVKYIKSLFKVLNTLTRFI
jgi:hypothetical protein